MQAGSVLGAGAKPHFARFAVADRRQMETPSHVDRAAALRAVEFVSADGDGIGPQPMHRDRQLPKGLSRVAVDQYAMVVADIADFADRLNGPKNGVGHLHTGQAGILTKTPDDFISADKTLLIAA